jgi:ethanolamine utilization protein EutN
LFLGKVIGNVVSTIKPKDFQGLKLLLVQPIQPEGKPWKDPLICIDIVDAGVGETVLYVDEGNSARQLLDLGPNAPVRPVIVGIVDEIQWEDGEGNVQSRTPHGQSPVAS